MNNLKLRKFEENIRNDIQNSEIPIGSVYYILKNIMNEVEFSYINRVNIELSQDKDNNKTEINSTINRKEDGND